MKIGIFGGTFDPPHLGHLRLAREAKAHLELDEVLFLPANQNPLKRVRTIAKPADRLEMVKAMLQAEEGMAVSDMEITRGGPSYTVDTFDELMFIQPASYWFLMGTDGLANMDEWKSLPRLAKLCRIGVTVRPPQTLENAMALVPPEFRESADFIPMEPSSVSSTEVRDRIATGKPVQEFLHPAVLRYIQGRRLYADQ